MLGVATVITELSTTLVITARVRKPKAVQRVCVAGPPVTGGWKLVGGGIRPLTSMSRHASGELYRGPPCRGPRRGGPVRLRPSLLRPQSATSGRGTLSVEQPLGADTARPRRVGWGESPPGGCGPRARPSHRAPPERPVRARTFPLASPLRPGPQP